MCDRAASLARPRETFCAFSALRIQIVHDLFDGDGAVSGMPAIVIGDHRDGGVTNFGFAREFGFGHVGHANHVEVQLAMHVRLSERGKLRTFHANVGAAAMSFYAGLESRRRQNIGDCGHTG